MAYNIPPPEKVGVTRPLVPHQIAPMHTGIAHRVEHDAQGTPPHPHHSFSLLISVQVRNEGGKGSAIPREPSHYGGAKSLREARNGCGGLRKVPTMSQVLSSIQYICFLKSSALNTGRQTCFLPRAPSNLVTPLSVLSVRV